MGLQEIAKTSFDREGKHHFPRNQNASRNRRNQVRKKITEPIKNIRKHYLHTLI